MSYLLKMDCLLSHGQYFIMSCLSICLQSNAAALLQSMTNHLNAEARYSQDVDVIQQVGVGLLNGMSYVLNILTKNEPTTDVKQIGKPVESNKQLEKFDAKLNKVRRYKDDIRSVLRSLSTLIFINHKISHSMECGESMLFVIIHIPYLCGISNSFSISFIDFYTCEDFSPSDMRKNET